VRLDPTTNDLIGVALVAFAAAMTVALLVATPAPVTQTVGEWLHLCFGKGSLLVPLGVMLFALTFFMDNYGPISLRIAIGLALIVLAILSIMSILCPGAEADPSLVLQTEVLLERGGYAGGGVAWALLSTVGFGVGLVALITLLVVGGVICGFSISGFVAKVRKQAAETAADVQASRARRAQERDERRAAKRQLREGQRLARAAGYDEYQPYEVAGGATEAPVADAASTSYIGDRKTTVLRRDQQRATQAMAAPAGPTLGETVTSTLGALPTRILRRRRDRQQAGQQAGSPVQTMPEVRPRRDLDPNLPAADDAYDEAPEELPWDDADDTPAPAVTPATFPSSKRSSGSRKRPTAAAEPQAEAEAPSTKKPRQTTIPDFLRQQAEATAASGAAFDDDEALAAFGVSAEDEDADAHEGGGRSSAKASASSAKKGNSKKRSGQQSSSAKGKKADAATRTPSATAAGAADGDDEPEYVLPPFEILAKNPHSSKSAAGEAELDSTMRRLQATLNEFGLKSRVVEYVAGPLVTTFHIEMGEGERVNRITNLEDDIALSLAAESVRIFAPIPGTSRVGIEIPNKKRENVFLGDVLPYAKGGPLEFAIGRDSGGKAVIADLAKMPHLLVAGTTGSGKSVMINALIMSILMRDTPKQVRLILVDPKRVEFAGYNGLPHLYVPVVTEPRQAASALAWAVSEMERRLKVFEKAGARNIGVYNEMCVSGDLSKMDNPPEPMPFLVIIIDELSDLMMVAGKDVESSIVRIAQLARAAGIHLVLATQRPSADVVTGLIKSNVETRIALSVASSMDSRVIIDQTGAERLLGHGDMLFKFSGHRTRRVLGCYASDDEINATVEHWRGQGQPDYHEEILSAVALDASRGGGGGSDGADADDPLVWEAAQIVVESRLGSTSGLQRRLKVGYARAGRIMDMLEAKGVVGPPDGSKPREVLLDEEGLEDLRAAEAKYREV
jgi:S-DNA-T family DNA segregation ATPase FtsK/SpoIIIE